MAEGCQCTSSRRFVRSLEEDEVGLPINVDRLARTEAATLGRCRRCGTWWERLPHEVYGYAWYQTEQRYWDAADQAAAVSGWSRSRREQGL